MRIFFFSLLLSSGVYPYPGQRVERVQAVHRVQGAPQPPENAVSPDWRLHLPTQESFRKQGDLHIRLTFVRLPTCTLTSSFILMAFWFKTTDTRPFQLEEALDTTQSQVVRSQLLVRSIFIVENNTKICFEFTGRTLKYCSLPAELWRHTTDTICHWMSCRLSWCHRSFCC